MNPAILILPLAGAIIGSVAWIFFVFFVRWVLVVLLLLFGLEWFPPFLGTGTLVFAAVGAVMGLLAAINELYG